MLICMKNHRPLKTVHKIVIIGFIAVSIIYLFSAYMNWIGNLSWTGSGRPDLTGAEINLATAVLVGICMPVAYWYRKGSWEEGRCERKSPRQQIKNQRWIDEEIHGL